MANEERVRGLPSVAEAREARRKLRWPSPKFWAWTGLVLAASAILHWKWSQGRVESERQKLMADQRAVQVELGPRWVPLRSKIEGWTVELANAAGPEVVERDELQSWDFRGKPGIYLRMRVQEAKDAETIRKGAKDSLRDAFTSCLLRNENPNPLEGKECKKTRECPTGEHCNEADRCTKPAQPYNLRVAYRTMNVLSDEWIKDVQDASSELRLKLLVASFEDAVKDDIPLAVDLLTRAQYFLVVLDETPEGMPAPAPGVNPTEALHAVPHAARVAVWRLSDGKLLLRVRREAGGELLGAQPVVDPDVMEARQRQANSCALALAVRQAMGDSKVPVAP